MSKLTLTLFTFNLELKLIIETLIMGVIRTVTFLLLCIIFFSCDNSEFNLESENIRLQKEVDSLSNELQKCEMLIESYEGMPMNI